MLNLRNENKSEKDRTIGGREKAKIAKDGGQREWCACLFKNKTK